MILIIAETLPAATETMATIMPMADNIKVIVQAHPLPFHKPYAITKYAMPNANNIIPIPTIRRTSPLARNIIPPIAVSIAISVTPKGLCFWLSM